MALYAIRNSDAAEYASCRRRWGWTSALRGNLMPKGAAAVELWLGTGCHFALEDYHGHNRFGDPRRAWRAYVEAHTPDERPTGWEQALEVGDAVLGYYVERWLPRRDDIRTLWVDGAPQLEVTWRLPIPGCDADATGTLDRVVTDAWGRIWIVDYKFYKRMDTAKLENDRQVSTYLWAARQLYGKVEGLMHYQFVKSIPGSPQQVRPKKGPDGTLVPQFSKAKDAPVTYAAYKGALLDTFGRVPPEYQDHLNWLAMQEDVDGDMHIRRTLVRRTDAFLDSHEQNMRDQYNEMVREDIPLYPNPSHLCNYCPFKGPCLALDMDADYESLIVAGFVSRDQPIQWEERIRWPNEPSR